MLLAAYRQRRPIRPCKTGRGRNSLSSLVYKPLRGFGYKTPVGSYQLHLSVLRLLQPFFGHADVISAQFYADKIPAVLSRHQGHGPRAHKWIKSDAGDEACAATTIG